jgi:hypothetical protein
MEIFLLFALICTSAQVTTYGTIEQVVMAGKGAKVYVRGVPMWSPSIYVYTFRFEDGTTELRKGRSDFIDPSLWLVGDKVVKKTTLCGSDITKAK